MDVNDLSVPAAKPWWQSKIVIGVAVSLVSKLLIVSGLTGDISGDDAQKATDLVVGAIGLVGDGVALVGRVNGKPNVPLTGSKDKADELIAEAQRSMEARLVAAEEYQLPARLEAELQPVLPQGLVGQADAYQQERI